LIVFSVNITKLRPEQININETPSHPAPRRRGVPVRRAN
jgi:hypothetical protein